MENDDRNLAGDIAAAWHERRVWLEGRAACREHREAANNPYPARSPEHQLWTEGFAYEHNGNSRKSHWL